MAAEALEVAARQAVSQGLAAVDDSTLEVVGGVLRQKNALTVVKTADETVNNSSTVQDDDHLSFAIGANEMWFFDLFLKVNSPSVNSDLKLAFSLPAGGSVIYHYNSGYGGVAVGGTPNALVSTGLSVGGLAGDWGLGLLGWITNGSTAGTGKLQWAQNTPTAENTVLKKGSIWRLRKIA